MSCFVGKEVGHGCGGPSLLTAAIVIHRYLIHGSQQGVTHSKLYVKLCLSNPAVVESGKEAERFLIGSRGHPIEVPRSCEENSGCSFHEPPSPGWYGIFNEAVPFFYFLLLKNSTFSSYAFPLSNSIQLHPL